MAEIVLTNGMVAMIDDEDFHAIKTVEFRDGKVWTGTISGVRWSALTNKRSIYATASWPGRKPILLHRAVMNATAGHVVDHINHDGLDNRRCNLRLVTQTQNMANARHCDTSVSRFKGVWYWKQKNKYIARIKSNGKTIYLGLFDSDTDAAIAYNKKAIELRGEFAWLNPV